MKLIVGLGNPGREYEHTRHNVGFQVAEELAHRYRVTLKAHAKWKARAAKVAEIGDGVLLAEPTTFMNLSGWAVREIAAFHKLAPSDVLVVVDDADLPLGRLRMRTGGSAGGHNGLKSIIEHVGSDFSRLRIGVGHPGTKNEVVDFVLTRAGADEQRVIDETIAAGADAIEEMLRSGAQIAMNKLHARPEPPAAKDN